MSSREIALIVFACVFGSALLGFLVSRVLSNRHLSNDAKDIVKRSTGLIATLAALVLGLLVSAAKGTFDGVNNELMQMAVKIVLLDRVLAEYGPEAKEIRKLLKTGSSTANQQLSSDDESQQATLDTPEGVARLEGIQARIRALSPQNGGQRDLQSRAIEIAAEMAASRWLMLIKTKGTSSTPLLVVMVSRTSIIFAAWGMLAPRNLIVAGSLLACAISVSGATLLTLELDSPLTGWIRVSPVPMQEAISHLGQ